MPVRVLGCSGAVATDSRTTSFLVNDTLLIDAGTGVGDLGLDEMVRIDHVLLTHSHLDHIAALPLLADAVMRLRQEQNRPPIQVMALPQTLQALQAHIFNDLIWPDFTALPNARDPILSLHPLHVGQRLTLGGVTAEVLPATHTVPAVGYALWAADPERSACWAFTGDTGPNPALWARLNQLRVQQLIIETAFSDEDSDIAQRSLHLHPQLLATELLQLGHVGEVFITHIKPGQEQAVMTAIRAQQLPFRIQALQTGQRMPLGGSGLTLAHRADAIPAISDHSCHQAAAR
jgi:ribonuclease BN (tRNA processing enzyme)